jgi:hypothetical protein
VTGVEGGKFGVQFSVESSRDFFFHETSRPTLRLTQTPVQWEQEILSPELNWPGREAKHLSSCSIDFKRDWSYPSNTPVKLHGVCGENITFVQSFNKDLR